MKYQTGKMQRMRTIIISIQPRQREARLSVNTGACIQDCLQTLPR